MISVNKKGQGHGRGKGGSLAGVERGGGGRRRGRMIWVRRYLPDHG